MGRERSSTGPFESLVPLVLASGSPRRRRLLADLGLAFRVHESGVEEGPCSGSPSNWVEVVAHKKAMAVARRFPRSWVLGADTMVVLGTRIFGKPVSRGEAREMLEALSGRTHEVVTGMALIRGCDGADEERVGHVMTRVTFKPLTDGEIEAYVATGEPMDKAGAYGIQGVGAFLVAGVSGSYTNVVGLPLAEVVAWLMDRHVIRPVEMGCV